MKLQEFLPIVALSKSEKTIKTVAGKMGIPRDDVREMYKFLCTISGSEEERCAGLMRLEAFATKHKLWREMPKKIHEIKKNTKEDTKTISSMDDFFQCLEKTLYLEKDYHLHEEKLSQVVNEIVSGIEQIKKSKIINPEVLSGTRFVTYDSSNYYVITDGIHQATPSVPVEEVHVEGQGDFHVYKIPSNGYGKMKSDYRCLTAWMPIPEVEQTARRTGIKDRRSHGNELKVIKLPPKEKFSKIWEGTYDYTMEMFHEAGHIEEGVESPIPGVEDRKVPGYPFGSEMGKKKFFELLRSSKRFEATIIEPLIHILEQKRPRGPYPNKILAEAYAMMIDREAKRLYEPKMLKIDEKNIDSPVIKQAIVDAEVYVTRDNIEKEVFWKNPIRFLQDRYMHEETVRKNVQEYQSSPGPHELGQFLAIILEDCIPDFHERKKFFQEVMRK